MNRTLVEISSIYAGYTGYASTVAFAPRFMVGMGTTSPIHFRTKHKDVPIRRSKKIYKDRPYVPEPQLAKDPNAFQFIVKAIGEWFNGKSKTKNAVKSVEGVTKEAPWKEESITASEQSGTPYSGLSGEDY